jgi:four helix bundle protein
MVDASAHEKTTIKESRISNQEVRSLRSSTQLRAWQEGHALVLRIYRITKTFPLDEQFGLTNQLRRAAVSITSNIAEGFSRSSPREKAQFYSAALGSLTEVQNQLLIAKDVGYLSADEFAETAQRTVTISKITNGLMKKTRGRPLILDS